MKKWIKLLVKTLWILAMVYVISNVLVNVFGLPLSDALIYGIVTVGGSFALVLVTLFIYFLIDEWK